jgi:hypothetical protein
MLWRYIADVDIVDLFHGSLGFGPGIKRESGENPELPRSGKQVRTPR